MQTKLSTKGQVVLPGSVRRRLGLQAGDALEVQMKAGGVLLTPRRPRSRKVRILVDRVTGLPVLSVGRQAPRLTSAQVRELLAEFP
ncbi:MAG: hypothetical protein DMG21_10650 [Acidobacteria bacterium]|nr:MAG: hypothetical protein DMG21_10650 [Acidobacteriota bacterium]